MLNSLLNGFLRGKGCFRLLPWKVTEVMVNQVSLQNRPAVIYLNPWEFETQILDIFLPILTRSSFFAHFFKQERTLRKLFAGFSLTCFQDTLVELAGKLKAEVEA